MTGHRMKIVDGEIEVCDTCTNSLGYPVNWEQAHPVTEQATDYKALEQAARAAYIAFHEGLSGFDAARAWDDMTFPADEWDQEPIDWLNAIRTAMVPLLAERDALQAQLDTMTTEWGLRDDATGFVHGPYSQEPYAGGYYTKMSRLTSKTWVEVTD